MPDFQPLIDNAARLLDVYTTIYLADAVVRIGFGVILLGSIFAAVGFATFMVARGKWK